MMLERIARTVPTMLASFVCSWAAIDWLFFRDLTGGYTYYGAIPLHVADGIMGSTLLVAGLLLISGLACGKEFVTRVGYSFASLGFLMFAIGLLLSPLIPDDIRELSLPSSLTPGFNYLLLSVWMFFTAVGEWEYRHASRP